MVLRELARMTEGIKRYFGSLPVSFDKVVLIALAAVVLTGLQAFLFISAKAGPAEMGHIIRAVYVFPVLNAGVWLLVLPLFFKWILKANNTDWNLFKRNTFLLLTGLLFTVGHEVIGLGFYNSCMYFLYAFDYLDTFELDLKSGFWGLTKTFIEFWVIFFLLHHFHAQKKFREAQLRNIQLESNLVKAQMSALKNQLHPHFLFNSFNTISALMEEDIPLAQRMIAKLGLLLRKILKDGDVQLVTLENEVEMAKLYLEVEQIRFKGRLVARFAIDPKVGQVLVPTLLLQPAVENAIKHGFYNKTGACEIAIKAHEDREYVRIEIADNGSGKKNGANVSFGIGLTNMRDRLITSYGEDYELNIDTKPAESGFIVEVKIRKEASKNENISSPS